jgi:hypothetical protein
MSTLEVITKGILALEVANARGGEKNKAHIIGDIGGLGFGPNMTIIAFVHAIHGFGIRMKGREAYWGEDKHKISTKSRGHEIELFNL